MKNVLTLLLFYCVGITSMAQTKQELKERNKKQKAFLKQHSYVYIPSGTFMISFGDINPPTSGQNRNRVDSVEGFYMMPYEVSNFDYLNYVNENKKNDTTLAKALLPDTTVWHSKGLYFEAYMEYYFRHPAYRNYPVVGVTYNQAVDYAEWLTDQYNNKPESDKSFSQVKFRLPTEEEWEYAARGGLQLAVYPWGNDLLNGEGTPMANMLYLEQCSLYRDTVWKRNYLHAIDSTQPEFTPEVVYLSTAPDSYLGGFGSFNEANDIIAPVKSYFPNGYGLYNMTGNVAEYVDAYYDRSGYVDFSHDNKEPKREQDPSGITRGGSWRDPGYFGMVHIRQFYDGPDYASMSIGFRLIMEVIEY